MHVPVKMEFRGSKKKRPDHLILFFAGWYKDAVGPFLGAAHDFTPSSLLPWQRNGPLVHMLERHHIGRPAEVGAEIYKTAGGC
jgi:putative YphP/YqiW family bacilliredoxin